MLDEPGVTSYLDRAIRNWRRRRDTADEGAGDKFMAACYVDAFQSVRISILGAPLAEESASSQTPVPRGTLPCEACGVNPTVGRLCGACWATLPYDVQADVYSVELPGPEFAAALEKAVQAARALRGA